MLSENLKELAKILTERIKSEEPVYETERSAYNHYLRLKEGERSYLKKYGDKAKKIANKKED